MKRRGSRQSLAQTFAAPSALLLVTLIALVAGLVLGDTWDWLAIAALIVPLATIGWALMTRSGNLPRS
jgi:ribose/xylose/arabinose/galactoside ABC-type transport system permease subunit